MSAPFVHRKPAEPVQADLDFPPVEAARRLQHLPGLVFLDSATSDHAGTAGGHSLIGARPIEIIRGNFGVAGDRELLRRTVGRHQELMAETDRGFPAGGAVGWIEYDGRFVFGVYPEMLVFDHHSETWFETGGLSRKFESDPARVAVPGPIRFARPAASFCDLVSRAQEYIAAGDIYQVNLSHRFRSVWSERIGNRSAFAIYENLRNISPAPFAAYLDLDGRRILSSSPELFLRISGRSIRTRPIKGTRPRFRDPICDEKSAFDLLTSPKEIAELIMITDLERNDLGQICEFGSVRAVDLLKLERYEQVFHLVSTVEGLLRPEVDHIGAIAACFPGGSVTGAPKKRAREIIAELEREPRGLYTGAIGVLGFNGESRFNIAIRTAIVDGDRLHFHTGAGIVADSMPEREYEETFHKAAGLLQAFGDDPSAPLLDR